MKRCIFDFLRLEAVSLFSSAERSESAVLSSTLLPMSMPFPIARAEIIITPVARRGTSLDIVFGINDARIDLVAFKKVRLGN